MQHQPLAVTTLKCGGTVYAYRYGKLDASGDVVLAGLADDAQYLICADGVDGDYVACRSLNAGGSVEVKTEAAITTPGAAAYIRAGGMVSESSAGTAIKKGYFKRTAAIGETVEVEIANI